VSECVLSGCVLTGPSLVSATCTQLCVYDATNEYHTFQGKRVRFTFDEVKKTVKAKIQMDLDNVIINASIMGVLENVEISERRG